jgi:hypothetical protein
LQVVAVSGVIGFVAWMATMASAPRYSDGPNEDLGNPSLLFAILVGAALVGGFLVPGYARAIGSALALPGLLLSPWTAPRGDNDGLWVLIVFGMAVLLLTLVVLGQLAAIVRRRTSATR